MRPFKTSVLTLLVILPALFWGCGTGLGKLFQDKPDRPPATKEAAAGEEVYLLRVDQVNRENPACSGLAALAMVIRFWSQDEGSAAKFQDLECPEAGFQARDLVRLAVDQGFRALAYKGGLPDLFRQLTAGRPLIVALKEGDGLKYLVLSGHYQDGRLVVNDPLKGRRTYLIQDFMELWKGTGYSTVAVSPKN